MRSSEDGSLTTGKALLGLDIGERRIGAALARLDVRIANPLTTIENQSVEQSIEAVASLVRTHEVAAVVAGWPRGLAGQHTSQTRRVEAFVADLRTILTVPVYLQDEALTSQKAEAELAARRKPYTKADIDALAATYILEDYIGGAAHV